MVCAASQAMATPITDTSGGALEQDGQVSSHTPLSSLGICLLPNAEKAALLDGLPARGRQSEGFPARPPATKQVRSTSRLLNLIRYIRSFGKDYKKEDRRGAQLALHPAIRSWLRLTGASTNESRSI